MDKNTSPTKIVASTVPKASAEVMDLESAKARIDAFEAALLKSRQRQMEMGNQVVMLGAQRRALQAAQRKLWAKYRKLGAAYGKLRGKVECTLESRIDPPVDMVLHCPNCHAQHIDAPSEGWDNPPHRSHECQKCHYVWRPADVTTNGVLEVKTKGTRDSNALSWPGMQDEHY